MIPDVCLCVLHGCANARLLSFRNSQDGLCSLSYSNVWAIRHFRIHLHAWLCAIRASCDYLSGVHRRSKAVTLGGVYGRWWSASTCTAAAAGDGAHQGAEVKITGALHRCR